VKAWHWLGAALACLAFARGARVVAEAQQHEALTDPYAPSPSSAPFVALGYREAAADALFVRLRGYFGDTESTPEAVAGLCEAIVALDPRFHRTYEYCAGAMTFFALTNRRHGNNAIYLRAIALLETGMREFPDDWRLPNLAGQILTQDLQTDDAAQRQAWNEKGTLLVEQAVRKPGAPAELADWAAVMRTKLGQQERAVRDLREVLLVTTDKTARKALIRRLALLENQNADAIAGEIYEARHKFEREWQSERPTIPAGWYILLGRRPGGAFDPVDLATGGHDLVVIQPEEKLEPLEE
jgi:hypothetical protein